MDEGGNEEAEAEEGSVLDQVTMIGCWGRISLGGNPAMLSLITLSLWEVPTAADTAKFTDIKKGEAPVPRGFALDNGGL